MPTPRFHRSRLSLRFRLLALTCGLLIATVAVFGGITHFELRRAALDAAEERLTSVSGQVADLLSGSANAVNAQMADTARQAVVRGALSNPRGDSARALASRRGPTAQDIGTQLWDTSGRVVFSIGDSVPALAKDEVTALIALLGDSARAAIGWVRLVGNGAAYPAIAQVRDSGSRLGYVVHWRHLSTPNTRRQLSALIGSSASIALGNARGDVWTDLMTRRDPPPMSLGSGGVGRYSRSGSARWIAGAARIGGTPWTLLVEFPEQVVLAPLTRSLLRLAAVAVLLLAIGATSAWAASRTISSPIDDLSRAAAAIQSGDFSQRVKVTRQDEVGALATMFNEMSAALAEGRVKTEADARELARRAEEAERARGELERALDANARIADEHRQLEVQYQHAQKMEAVGRLAGGLAHDFNNILTAIISFSEFALIDLAPDSPARDDIAQVNLAAERAAVLNRKLLAFSRQQVLQPRVIDLSDVVSDIEPMLRRLLPENIELRCLLAPDLWPVHADPGQMEQVIVNLAINAGDAMPNGGALTISTSPAELDEEYVASHAEAQLGPHVLLCVTDSGVGMDRATQARVFEPFFTTKDPGKGTGLGLAMVYGVVKQSGGSIWLYSEPGHGTTFKIYLPRHEGVESAGSSDQVMASTAAHRRGIVLVVEDEEPVRRVARRILERMGHQVLDAPDGAAALEALRRVGRPVDLVITDLIMPRMGGRELVERLRAEGEMGKTRFLFMSGYTIDTATNQSLVMPNDAYLEKPFTPEALARKVHEVMAA